MLPARSKACHQSSDSRSCKASLFEVKPAHVGDIELSIVIPAFNERVRLPEFLALVRSYVDRALPGAHEVIVVDDGSTDGLKDWLAQEALTWNALRPISHEHNRGKGAAVCTGMLAARGNYILYADADGATPIGEEVKLREALRKGGDVAIATRNAPESEAHRTPFRRIQGAIFVRLVRQILELPVSDTQCGFKMLTRAAVHRVFPRTVECGYLLDVELLLIAQRQGLRINEFPIRWIEKPGSKVQPLQDIGKMFTGLWRIRKRHGRAGRKFAPLPHCLSLPK